MENKIINKKKKNKWKEYDPNEFKKEIVENVIPVIIEDPIPDIFCKKFLKNNCDNYDCNFIHNFSLKHKKENNSEFFKNYNILADDYHLIIKCNDIIKIEKSLQLNFKYKNIVVFNKRKNNHYELVKKNINKITHNLNKKRTKVIYQNFLYFNKNLNIVKEIYFFTNQKNVLSTLMKSCIFMKIKLIIDEKLENILEELYCVKIIEKENIEKIIIDHFKNNQMGFKDYSFFLLIQADSLKIEKSDSITSILNMRIEIGNKIDKNNQNNNLKDESMTKTENLIKRINIQNNLEETLNLNNSQVKEIRLRIEKIKHIEDWNNLSNKEYNCVCHTLFIKKDRNINFDWTNPLIQTSQMNSRVKIFETPFSKGSMRYAFYMYDTHLKQKMVCKIPIYISDKNYNIETLSKDIETIVICQFLADSFNEKILNIISDTNNLLNFVHCFIYEITENDLDGFSLFQVENFIEGNYEKYNNNFGWINEKEDEYSLIAQTFSHFSWQFTKGFLLINDLQGVKGVLTDPQIHCLNMNKYGMGNLGYLGILQFFKTHKCNLYCEKLNLLHPKDKIEIKENFDFFVDMYTPPENNEEILKLCDLCRTPCKVSQFLLYQKKKWCKDYFCEDCEYKRNKSLTKQICIDCNKKFYYSSFWFKMKRTATPIRCHDCRFKNRNKLRKEKLFKST